MAAIFTRPGHSDPTFFAHFQTEFLVEARGLAGIEAILGRLVDPALDDLLDRLGAEGESQTRRRISSEKTAPDGAPWEAWTAAYAKTRHGGNALLEGEGDLYDSIQSDTQGADAVAWGSNLAYAAIHQHGGLPGMPPGPAGIPARPYLGISAENAADLLGIATEWVEELLQ